MFKRQINDILKTLLENPHQKYTILHFCAPNISISSPATSFFLNQLFSFSELRSDYVEGISPETVQTSLGRDIGHLNFQGARVNPQVGNTPFQVELAFPWWNELKVGG